VRYSIDASSGGEEEVNNYAEERRINKMQKTKIQASLIMLLLLATMIMATTFTTTQQMMQNTSGKGTSHGNPTRQGSPPTGMSWARTYGGSQDDIAWPIQQTSDGGYIVAGYTNSFGLGNTNAFILKLNSTGGVTWQESIGGSHVDVVHDLQKTSDGGYIAAGYTDSYGAGSPSIYSAWVLKLNSTGGVTWQKTYGNSTGRNWAYSVQQTSDGGYIVAGVTESFGAGGWDIWVLKLNSTGGVTWQKTYGGPLDDGAWSVQQTIDGGYIVAGYTSSYGIGGNNYWVLKLNSTGGVTWQKTYGISSDDVAYDVRQTSDGGYIVVGQSWKSSGNYSVWVLKLNSTGGVSWQNKYGGTRDDVGSYVTQSSDGGYIISGATSSWGAGGLDYWVLKLNSTGGITWQKAYGGTGDDEANSVQQTSDGGYIVAGATKSFSAGGWDFWVVKLGSNGEIEWDGGSGAKTNITTAVASPSGATITNTGVTGVDSHATVQSSTAVPKTTNCIMKTQSTPDTTPPATITDLATSSPTTTSVTLTWTAPGDNGMLGNATGYVVKYSTSGAIDASNWNLAATYSQSWTPAKNGTTETHTVTGLSMGTTYWFAVVAYDSVPNYSGVSNSPSATTTKTTPSAPQNLVASAGIGWVMLTWSAPSSNGGSPVTGYDIYRGVSSGGETLLITLGSVTTYNDTAATKGQPYYYEVSAVNGVGEGAKSGEVFARTMPTAPSIREYEGGGGWVALNWSAPSSNGGSAVTGYRVYRGPSSGGETLLAAIGNVTTYEDTHLWGGQTYYYEISAVNLAGEGAKSSEVQITPSTGAPSAPQNLVASAGNGWVALTWSAPSSNGGAAVTGYWIYRGPSSNSMTSLASIGNVTTYNDTTVTGGQTYYYEVYAMNRVGVSDMSSETFVRLPPATSGGAGLGAESIIIVGGVAVAVVVVLVVVVLMKKRKGST
jgi:uncharacterized delta-60 repeat protein